MDVDLKTPEARSHAESLEWLEADGLGGYAMGTALGVRTRRYHGLLLTATTPPTGRMMLVNGFDAWLETGDRSIALSSQRYLPDVIAPDGCQRLQSFNEDAWPHWISQVDPGITLKQELFVPRDFSACVLIWTLAGASGTDAGRGFNIVVRPFLSGRDYHATHHENTAFRFAGTPHSLGVTWKPYNGLPAITALTNGTYRAEPYWYHNFLYTEERERGLDCVEDLATPGTFSIPLRQPAVLIFAAEGYVKSLTRLGSTASEIAKKLAETERKRRAAFHDGLARSADAYLVRRCGGSAEPGRTAREPTVSSRTIIAGYPWFTDWGRDTFIALRGLCLAGGRMSDAAEILTEWADTISEGMLPNRFPDQGAIEYNSVDASLWYVVAVGDFLARSQTHGPPAPPPLVQKLRGAVQAILSGYFRGTRYAIGCDSDGLLHAGVPGEQLTWMDARVGDRVITPRIGKPVEIEALWLSALKIGEQFDRQWHSVYSRGLESFRTRFWNESLGCLYDVVDVDHQSGKVDRTVRPNQIFAVGGLPDNLLDVKRARRVVDLVEAQLWTPLGLRTLDPADPNYVPHYVGGANERDAAYHQGTAWPWLAGPFIEAWVRVRGNSDEARLDARHKFVYPLVTKIIAAGLRHLPEIADGDPPHTPRGCPFQAWSLGELIRVQALLDTTPR